MNMLAQTVTDTWTDATWENFQIAVDRATKQERKTKAYYYNGWMKLEMSPVGNPHARDHFIISSAISFYATLRQIAIDGLDNCSYRKTGNLEVQPDLSFYISDNAGTLSWDTRIVDLDRDRAPDLAIEIADGTLSDDRGQKHLLYEEIGVAEYWVVDVENSKITAFETIEGGSRKICVSQVLPGLELNVLESALKRCRQTNHARVMAWLLQQWQ